ncbi:MAG: hypothetical protein HKN41_11615 [Ilumatobacter sp.]|nr:hypothetical protein [Ilumatobacter sp.]
MRGGGGRWALLGSPLFAASIAVLLINDHVLKAAWPGLVTGKLSDVAGVVMVAIALTAVIGSARIALTTTAVGFAALKTVPAVAVWAAPVLGGVTRTDPTDLIALLALVPLSWTLCLTQRSTRRATDSLGVRIVLVGAAVFATTATSCAPGGVWNLEVADGVVLADVQGDVWESEDGGATWRRSSGRRLDSMSDRSASSTCVDGRCFRIDTTSDVTRVVENLDGVETVLLEWDGADSDELAEAVDWGCGDGSFWELVAVGGDGGEISLVVAMTEAGTLRWTASDRRWTWVAVGGWGLDADRVAGLDVAQSAADPTLFESTWPGRVVLVATTLLAFAAAPAVGRLARSRRRAPGGYVAGVIGIGFLTLVPLFAFVGLADDWRTGDGRFLFVAGCVVAVLTAAAIGIVVGLATRPRSDLPAPDADRRLG